MTKRPPVIRLDEHHVKCPTCGASVDLRDLAQVLVHDDPNHGPKLAPVWRGSKRKK